jgi:hypothetical protein
MRTLQITPHVTALTSTIEIPMLGVLPINSFLIKGNEPMLVDTGITPERDEFLAALGELIDPADLRWIWLTHADRDHTGSISELLERAPNARIAATFTTIGLMGVGNQPIPPERAYIVRDGTHVPTESHELIALRPPLFDNPGTAGFFDPSSRVLFSSDFFGGLMPSHEAALSDDVASVGTDDVVAGQLLWGSADAPWVHTIDETKFGDILDEFRRFDADVVLSTHLPPIRGTVDQHLKTISTLPSSTPTMSPDQGMLEAAMAEIAHSG